MIKLKNWLSISLSFLHLMSVAARADDSDSPPWIYNDFSCKLEHFNSSVCQQSEASKQTTFYYCSGGNGIALCGSDYIMRFNGSTCGHQDSCEYYINDWCVKGYQGNKPVTIACPKNENGTRASHSSSSSTGIRKLALPQNIFPKSMLMEVCYRTFQSADYLQSGGSVIVRVNGEYGKEKILYNSITYDKMGVKHEIGSIIDSQTNEVARLSSEQSGNNVRLIITDATPDLKHAIGSYHVFNNNDGCVEDVSLPRIFQNVVFWDIQEGIDNKAKKLDCPHQDFNYFGCTASHITDNGLRIFGKKIDFLQNQAVVSVVMWKRERLNEDFSFHELAHWNNVEPWDVKIQGFSANEDTAYLLVNHNSVGVDDVNSYLLTIHKDDTSSIAKFGLKASGYWVDKGSEFVIINPYMPYNPEVPETIFYKTSVHRFNNSTEAIPYIGTTSDVWSSSLVYTATYPLVKNNILESIITNPKWEYGDYSAPGSWNGEGLILLEMIPQTAGNFYTIDEYFSNCNINMNHQDYLSTLIFDVKKESNGYISFYSYGIHEIDSTKNDEIFVITVDPNDCKPGTPKLMEASVDGNWSN